MDINELYSLFLKQGSVSTDSRKCTPGAVFFALKGGNFDGNEYAAAALENGCAYAVVDDPQYAADGRYVLVDDALQTLRDLAKIHRKTLKAKIIGITGTNGKTTTKELVSAVLSKKYKTRHTIGNLNNHIGVPLTLLSFSADDEIGVVEMGANHPGEIKSSVDIVCPDYGLITNVGIAHIEGFGSFEGVKKTKGELYDYLRNNSRAAFVYADSADLMRMSDGMQRILYGSTEDCRVKGRTVSASPFLKAGCVLPDGRELDINTKLIGDYNISNVLSAVCVGDCFGVPAEDIKAALEEYEPSNKRSQLVTVGDTRFILDAYNANPTSMAAAIENFARMEENAKCVILGDMGELGKDSEAEHQKVADLLKNRGFEDVYLVGGHFMHTYDNYVHFESSAQMTDYLSSGTRARERFAGKTILVKGSNSMRMDNVAQTIMQKL